MFKKTISTLFLAGLFLPQAPLLTFAAQNGPCVFTTQFEKLETIRKNKNGLDYLENVKSELALRKEILKNTLVCATEEARLLESSLKEVDSNDNRIVTLQNQLLKRLEEAFSYYASQITKVDSLGLRGSQDMARTVREWRVNTYASLQEKITVFLLWEKNQTLLRVAEARFAQISQTMNNLKLTESEDIKKAFDTATQSLEKARAMHKEAERELDSFDTEKDSLTLVRDALTALSSTYEDFLELSRVVTAVIPATSKK